MTIEKRAGGVASMATKALSAAFLAAALSFAAPALAQEAQPAAEGQPAQPAAEGQPAQPAPAKRPAPEDALPEPAPTHLEAAVEFLRVSGATKGFEEMIPQFLDQIRARFVTQRPEIAQVINDASFSLIPDFVQRRDQLNRNLGKLYATKFTEAELKELTAFYSSPIGQKLAAEQVRLVAESVPLVQSWSRRLNADMVNRIREEVGKQGHKL